MAAKTFWKWRNKLPEKFMDNDDAEHMMWIVPEPFYAIHYRNDAGYLPLEATQKAEGLIKQRKNNNQPL